MTELAIGIILGCCALGAGIAMIAGIGPGHRRRQCRGKGVRGHRPPAGVQRKRYNHHADGCAVAETTGLYALVIAILLIFVAPNMLVNILMNFVG